jgi:glycosyltransferase involved in cell wall biosynthesis
LIEDCCLRHAHRIVTVSEVLADELKQRGVPAEKIVWYPNCIDPEMFDPRRYVDSRKATRDRLGLRDDELAVLFLGTFGVWHGAETLAQAARQYLASAPATAQRVRFVFVGDGLRLAAVRETLQAEIAAGQVILTGLVPQDQAPEYLAAADIFMSPHVPSTDGSKFFGSPTKLFEYMAMERPIIASALDQLTQVLSPALDETRLSAGQAPTGDETAILTVPGDVQALVRALTYLRDRPVVRDSLARAARRRALDHYTWTRHVDVIMRTLR